MKYKKQIATGALAISLLVGGSNVFASTPQDLGIKSTTLYQKQHKSNKNSKKGKNNIVGTIETLSGSGFTLDIKNAKTKTTSSVDVQTNSGTTYSKNGFSGDATLLSAGQKVTVTGNLDKTTNIFTAKTVKIAS